MTRTSGTKPIPLAIPLVGECEWAYVKECLETGWVSTAGPFVERFEHEVAQRVGAAHAVATANGTVALHVALLVAGVGANDEVLVPTLTFIAPVNAIRYCGAHPVFMDVDPVTWQLDAAKVLEFLKDRCQVTHGRVINRRSGRRVAAVVAVHLLGHPVDLHPLLEASRQLGIPLIEDGAQSLGARYHDRHVGQLGELTCFSFNGNKVVTAGGGGMITTSRSDWARQARYLTTQAKDDPVWFVHDNVGYNYRLTNVHAAIGVAQLERLEEFIGRKRAIWQAYRDALADRDDFLMIGEEPWAFSTFWLSTLRVIGNLAARRDELLRELLEGRVEARPPWRLNHLQKSYAGAETFCIEHAVGIAATGLHLPSSVGMTANEQSYVIELLLGAADRLRKAH